MTGIAMNNLKSFDIKITDFSYFQRYYKGIQEVQVQENINRQCGSHSYLSDFHGYPKNIIPALFFIQDKNPFILEVLFEI